MPLYQYIASNDKGESFRGMLSANDKNDLSRKLQSRGLFLVFSKAQTGSPSNDAPPANSYSPKSSGSFSSAPASYSSQPFVYRPPPAPRPSATVTPSSSSTRHPTMSTKGSVNLKELCVLTRQLSISIHAGMSLVEALEGIYTNCKNPKMAHVVRRILDDILSGSKFSEALAAHRDVFTPVYISMASAGEIGGFIPEALNRMAEFLEAEMELHRKIKAAMVYPSIIAAVAMMVVTGMMVFVVPVFVKLFSQLGAELPAPTRLLLHASLFTRHGGFLIPFVFVGLFYFLSKFRLRNETFRAWWDETALSLPVFGKLITLTIITRFIRTFATLAGNGVMALQAIAISREVVGNRTIEKIVDELYSTVQQGGGLATVFYKSKYFPVLVANMVSTGEKTGSVPDVLMKVAGYYEAEVTMQIQALLTMLEPLMIVLMAVVVGFIVAGLLLPTFQISTLF